MISEKEDREPRITSSVKLKILQKVTKILCIFVDDNLFQESRGSNGSVKMESIDLIVSAQTSTRFKCKLRQTNSIRLATRDSLESCCCCQCSDVKFSERCAPLRTASNFLTRNGNSNNEWRRRRVFIPQVCVASPWRNVSQILAEKSVSLLLSWLSSDFSRYPPPFLFPFLPAACSVDLQTLKLARYIHLANMKRVGT